MPWSKFGREAVEDLDEGDRRSGRRVDMAEPVYKEPSDLIADLPWSSHACHFYKSQKDLLDILVPYFKAGLLNREFCISVASKDVGIKHALSVLKRGALPKVESFLEPGS